MKIPRRGALIICFLQEIAVGIRLSPVFNMVFSDDQGQVKIAFCPLGWNFPKEKPLQICVIYFPSPQKYLGDRRFQKNKKERKKHCIINIFFLYQRPLIWKLKALRELKMSGDLEELSEGN